MAQALWRLRRPLRAWAILSEELERDGSRLQAVRAVAELGPIAKEAVPVLLRLLQTVQPDERRIIQQALQKIDPKSGAKAGVP
jgi:hypothetical protein